MYIAKIIHMAVGSQLTTAVQVVISTGELKQKIPSDFRGFKIK
jgi:hypothetical protein